jgi:hypothetical protein
MAHVYNEAQLTAFLDQMLWRLRLIEAQLALMFERLQVPYDDAASMTPAEVVDLLVRATDGDKDPQRSPANRHHEPARSARLLATA